MERDILFEEFVIKINYEEDISFELGFEPDESGYEGDENAFFNFYVHGYDELVIFKPLIIDINLYRDLHEEPIVICDANIIIVYDHLYKILTINLLKILSLEH